MNNKRDNNSLLNNIKYLIAHFVIYFNYDDLERKLHFIECRWHKFIIMCIKVEERLNKLQRK